MQDSPIPLATEVSLAFSGLFRFEVGQLQGVQGSAQHQFTLLEAEVSKGGIFVQGLPGGLGGHHPGKARTHQGEQAHQTP